MGAFSDCEILTDFDFSKKYRLYFINSDDFAQFSDFVWFVVRILK